MARATWLDRAIAYVAPARGLERVKARAHFDAASRAYAGAALGRHTDGWKVVNSSADAEIAAAGTRLRDRSRDLVRNNPHAAKAISIWTNNLIGDGIIPVPVTGDDDLNARVRELFEAWSKTCDADGQLDFYGLQALAVRGMIEGGETLVRRRMRKREDGLRVPVQVQMLEPDYLDETRHGALTSGNTAVQGIEFDLIGRRAAYWLLREHPGSSLAITRQASRVPADDVAHLYEKQRSPQARGVPWTAPVIRRLRDIDDYDFAEGMRKKIEASTVAFVTSDNEFDEGVDGVARVTDAKGNLIERFAPGLIAYLRGGKDVKFNQPATVGGYEEYKRVSAREVAAGLRVPYELLTGDLSSVNFSSARVGIVEFRRFCSTVQWQIVIPMLLDPMWRWFCMAAYLVGELPTPDIKVRWAPPKWQAIEPYKDALADLIVLRTGTRSFYDVAAERGYDPADVINEIEAWNKKLDEKGITLDSDPRRTNLRGVLQKVLPGQDQGDAEIKAGGQAAE